MARLPFAGLAVLVLLIGCAARPPLDPNVRVADSADLAAFSSFAFSRDDPMVRGSLSFPELNTLSADRAIRSAITRVMIGKNYAAAPRDQADLLITYALDVGEFADLPEDAVRQHFRTRDSRSGYESGRRVEATVTISMIERHTGIELWQSSGRQDWPDGERIDFVMDRAVSAALGGVALKLQGSSQ